jgi:hypothetical protein
VAEGPGLAGRRFHLGFYNDPDNYLPIINGVRMLASEGAEVRMSCRSSEKDWGVSYPTSVHVDRLSGGEGVSSREYARFVAHALARGGDRRLPNWVTTCTASWSPA